MATAQDTMTYLLDQLADLAGVRARKMFGEYCLYMADKPVALVCDDRLYLKPTDAVRTLLPQIVEVCPYPGAKPYWLITADLWEDRAWLGRLLQATERALPMPLPRKEKR